MNFSNTRIQIFLLVLLGTFCGSGSIFSQETNSLKDIFKDYFMVGAAISRAQYSGADTAGIELAKKHFNTITPENILKWESVHPKPGKYEFAGADSYVSFGEKNGMFIIGHTLVWHAQTPRWVFESSAAPTENKKPELTTRDTLLQRIHDHIATVVGRYKGRVKGWDVVNEALNEDGTLRQSIWMKIIGEDFIEKAFQYAHEADPDAELYYNDYSLVNKPKLEGAIRIIKNLKAKGIRIDGIGLQGHYKMDWPSYSRIDSALTELSQLGVKVMITELDLDVLPSPGNNTGADISLNYQLQEKLNPFKKGIPDSMQNLINNRYADIFKALVKHKDIVDRVTFWGVCDRDSWLNNWPVRGRTNYPLLFDREHKIKPEFNSVINTVKIN